MSAQQELVHPDPSNPKELARSAVSALKFAATWSRLPGNVAKCIARSYALRAHGLLKIANRVAAQRKAAQP